MVEVQGDLSPVLGPQLVRLDPARFQLIEDVKVLKAIQELCGLSPARFQQTRQRSGPERIELVGRQEPKVTIQPDQILYLMWEYDSDKRVSRLLGFLKIGRKQLFLYDKRQQPYEGILVCLLDFYVHYAHQRKGIASRLFEYMLEQERVEQPYEVALDNPSVTLLGFFSKKFGLDEPVWQNTNFVVFPQLFAAQTVNNHCNTPEGWGPRPSTPRHIILGADERQGKQDGIRWLANAITGHSEAKRGRDALPGAHEMDGIEVPRGSGALPERTLADRSTEARNKLLKNLSSKPLW